MPSPQDGKAGILVPPAAPTAATDADDAQPGVVEEIKAEQRQTQTGKYGSEPVTPYVKPAPDKPTPDDPTNEKKKSWVGLKLTDQKGKPVAGECYSITLPDKSVATGTTDADGTARVDGLDPGSVTISFPNLDNAAVKPL